MWHITTINDLRPKSDVAQTLAVGQLCKGHHPELLGTSEQLRVAIATMSIDDAGEGRPRQKIHQL